MLTNGSNILHRSRWAKPSDLATVPEKKLWELTAALSLARLLARSSLCAWLTLKHTVPRPSEPHGGEGGRTALVIMFNLLSSVSLVLSVELSKGFYLFSCTQYSIHKPREEPYNNTRKINHHLFTLTFLIIPFLCAYCMCIASATCGL